MYIHHRAHGQTPNATVELQGYVKGRVAHLEELFHKLSSEPPVEGDPATICSLPAGMLPPDAPKGTMQSFSIEDQLRAAAPPRTTPVEDLTPRGPCTSSFKRAEHALLSTTATCPSSSLLGSPAGLPPRAPAVGPSPMSSPLVHSSAYASADPPPRATSPSPMSRPISQPLAIPHAAEPSPTSSSTITSFATPANPTSQTSDLERHAQARALGLDDPEDDIFFLQRPKTAAAATAAPDSEPSLTAEAAESTVAGSISLTPPPMSSEERTGVTDHGAPTSAEASVTSKDINNVISDACSSNVQQTAVGCSGDDEALPSAASKAKFAGHPNTIYGRTFAFSSASVPKLLANAAVNASAFEVVKSSSSHTQTVDSKDKSSDTSFPAPTSVRDHVPTLSFALLANADAPAAQAQHSSLPADEGLVTPRNECSGMLFSGCCICDNCGSSDLCVYYICCLEQCAIMCHFKTCAAVAFGHQCGFIVLMFFNLFANVQASLVRLPSNRRKRAGRQTCLQVPDSHNRPARSVPAQTCGPCAMVHSLCPKGPQLLQPLILLPRVPFRSSNHLPLRPLTVCLGYLMDCH